MEEILQQINQNLEAINQRLAILEADPRMADPNGFVSPDEALEILGFQPTRHGRRRLQFLRERGVLKRFTSRKPYNYQRGELLYALKRIESGELIVPAKF